MKEPVDESVVGTEEDPHLWKHMPFERGGVRLEPDEIRQVLLDLGYRAVPHLNALSAYETDVGAKELDILPLSAAVAAFAHAYHNNSPYPAYSVSCDGVIAGFDRDSKEENRERALVLLSMKKYGEMNSGKKTGNCEPTYTDWIAKAYAAEMMIKPDSYEATLWARREADAVMKAIDKAIVEKGGSPPERVFVQI